MEREPRNQTMYVDIDAGDWRFHPRVAAVCAWHGHVLLQGALDGDFWVLPGGRVQPLEVTTDALRRTMSWELDQEVSVGQLLWVMEYVYPVGQRTTHELGFYYAIELPEDSQLLDLTREHVAVERGHDLVLRWFPLGALSELRLFPAFLRTALQDPPATPQHVVQTDRDPIR